MLLIMIVDYEMTEHLRNILKCKRYRTTNIKYIFSNYIVIDYQLLLSIYIYIAHKKLVL